MIKNKKTHNKVGFFLMLVFPFILASFYNACGRVGTPGLITSDSDVLGLGKAACEADLQTVFAKTYHPFLVSNCNSCHSSAQGSQDVSISFRAFMQKGASLIDTQATRSHGGNSLGPHIQPQIDAFKSEWNVGQEKYLTCIASANPFGSSNGLLTVGKIIPNLSTTLPLAGQTTSNKWVKVQWDLSMDLEQGASDPNYNKFQAILEMEAKFLVYSGFPVGFQFRNPTLKLKSDNDAAVEVSGIQIYVDGELQSDVTTYLNITGEATSTTAIPLAANVGSAVDYYANPGFNNQIALGISSIRNTSAGTTPAPTPTPTPTPTAPTSVTFTQLVSSDPTLGVFAKYCTSCHGATNPRAGLNLTDYAQASVSASTIINRMNDGGNPMPPSGILTQQYRDVVNVWVMGGKKQ